MAWLPIAQTVPQYYVGGDPATGYVLKFYADQTTTNISMATDNTGGTLLSSVALDSEGYPSNGGAIFIPHLEEEYKIALYPSQSAADADSGAAWVIDNLAPANISVASTDESAKVSSNDTTAGFLNGKLVPGNGIDFTENNDGANESLTVDVGGIISDFTSTGIDDNATKEVIQIGDTSAQLGDGSAAESYSINLRTTTDGNLVVSGGNASNDGGNIALFGSGNVSLRFDATEFLRWLESSGYLDLYGGSGASKTARLRVRDNNTHVEIVGELGVSDALGNRRLRIDAGNINSTINYANNGPLILQTNSTTALTLDDSQNATFAGAVTVNGQSVGISADVNPFFRVTDTTNTVSSVLQSLDLAGLVGTTTNHQFTVRTNNIPALTIDTSQNVTFAGDIDVQGGQIKFPATQNPSADVNTLDDYEEGTFNPTVWDSSESDAEGQTYTSQFGWYTKIGRMVHVHGYLIITSFGTLTGAQQARIGGLPFTSISGHQSSATIGAITGGNITAGQSVTGTIANSQNSIRLQLWDVATGSSALNISELDGGAGVSVYFSAVYSAA